MHLIYIDDSGDEKLSVYTAVTIPAIAWNQSFRKLREFRRQLRADYGIPVYKELHAWRFVSGRGNISNRVVTKYERSIIFNKALDVLADLPGVSLLCAVFPKTDHERAFERLLNRINRAMGQWKSHGVLICDAGNEGEQIRIVRRMSVFNPIPSAKGHWEETQKPWKNLPIDRVIEDPLFKKSDQSNFIQLCDFAGYALLRRENPLESKSKYGLDQSFLRLSKIVLKEAAPNDPNGIIRP